MSTTLQILTAVSGIALICYLAFRLTSHLMDRLIDLIFDYRFLRIGCFASLSLLFFVGAALKYSDFMQEGDLSFPLFSGVSALLAYLGIWSYQKGR